MNNVGAESAVGRARKRRAARESALNKSGQEKRALYHCNYCQKDISNTPRIKCAVCPDFDLCLECFSVGVEIAPHRSTHDYRVVDNLSFPILAPDWGTDEELLLLEAIEMYGLGSWQAVADHMGPTKTAAQCKSHYYSVYIDVPSFPEPTPTPEMKLYEQEKLLGAALADGLVPPSSSPVSRKGRRGANATPATSSQPQQQPANSQAHDQEAKSAQEPDQTPYPPGSQQAGQASASELVLFPPGDGHGGNGQAGNSSDSVLFLSIKQNMPTPAKMGAPGGNQGAVVHPMPLDFQQASEPLAVSHGPGQAGPPEGPGGRPVPVLDLTKPALDLGTPVLDLTMPPVKAIRTAEQQSNSNLTDAQMGSQPEAVSSAKQLPVSTAASQPPSPAVGTVQVPAMQPSAQEEAAQASSEQPMAVQAPSEQPPAQGEGIQSAAAEAAAPATTLPATHPEAVEPAVQADATQPPAELSARAETQQQPVAEQPAAQAGCLQSGAEQPAVLAPASQAPSALVTAAAEASQPVAAQAEGAQAPQTQAIQLPAPEQPAATQPASGRAAEEQSAGVVAVEQAPSSAGTKPEPMETDQVAGPVVGPEAASITHAGDAETPVPHLSGEQQQTAKAEKRLHRSHTLDPPPGDPAAAPGPAPVPVGTRTLHLEVPPVEVKEGIVLEPPSQAATPTEVTPVAASGGARPGTPNVFGGRAGGAGALANGTTPGPLSNGIQQEPAKPCQVQGDYAMGFHAKRNEFDPEYDNDAECIIADMEFTEQDTEEDRQLKLRILEIYNKRLDEREARKSFLREYGLLSMRKVQALERRRSSAERDTHARLRVFARYSGTKAHDDLVEGLLLEQRLRARIQELKDYRRMGVRTMEEAEIHDSEARRTKKQNQGNPLFGSDVSFNTLAPVLSWDGTQLVFGNPGQLTPGPSAAPSFMGPAQAAAVAAAAKDTGAASSATAPPPGGNKGAASSLAMWRTHRGVPLDITCLPGTEALTSRERELCVSLRLLPAHYLALKDSMLRDCAKNGPISRNEARTFFKLDPAKALRLYDLWVSCGWISADKAAAATNALKGNPSRGTDDRNGMAWEPAAWPAMDIKTEGQQNGGNQMQNVWEGLAIK